MLEANQVDGIISSSHNLGISDYNRVTAPIISFDRNLSPNIPVVSSDNFSGGVLAAETLVKNGCQNILMITGNDDSDSPTTRRRIGFSTILPQATYINTILPQATYINISSDFSATRKKMEIKSLIEHLKPDGIFASDDMTALLIMKIANDLGISIPEQLKIIGYDGTSFIEHYVPNLTSIKQPISDIAKLMVDLLIQKINGNPTTSLEYTLPISLLPGKSI